MADRYHKERIVLETTEGTARDIDNLKKVWDERCRKHFPHYRVVAAWFDREEGKEK